MKKKEQLKIRRILIAKQDFGRSIVTALQKKHKDKNARTFTSLTKILLGGIVKLNKKKI